MKKLIWILIATIYTVAAFPQHSNPEPQQTRNRQGEGDATVVGHILHKKTKEHIPYITISLKGTPHATSTDESGHYYLKELPRGDFKLVVSGVGYKTVELPVTLYQGKTIEVNVYLEEDDLLLETVVVSANRTETKRKEAPSMVSIISPMLLENTNSVTLAQGLNFQPGLRLESNCQNCGFQQVRINGLDGPYSQILIDSRPIFSALAGVYGIEQIPANMIERVEVMRGGGSALFGSNAIAGTINIITKEPKNNSISVSNITNMIGGSAPDNNLAFHASLVDNDLKNGLLVFGSNRQRDAFDYDKDGFTEIGKLEGSNIGMRAFYKFNNYKRLTAEYHFINEFRRGGNKLDTPPHFTDITEQTEHNIHSANGSYNYLSRNYRHKFNAYLSGQFIDRQSYYGTQGDPNAYGTTADNSIMGGVQYSYSIEKLLFMPSEVTTGAELNYNKMSDEMVGYNRKLDQEVNTKSLFLQNEWRNAAWSILAGVRVDKHNLIKDAIVSPRINIRFAPVPLIVLRGGYSTGFRAPQAFDEDLHITAVGGEVSIIQLSPQLRPEFSQSFTLSADLYRSFGSVQTNLVIEVFYTHLKDVFLLEEMGRDDQGNLLMERRNGSGALVRGVNVEGTIAPDKRFQLQLGGTLQKSLYTRPEVWSSNPDIKPQRNMFRTPDLYGYFTATCTPTTAFTLSFSGIYTGPMLVQHFAGYIPEDREFRTPDFSDFTVKLAYNFKVTGDATLQLNGGIQNLFNSFQEDFDQGPLRDAGYMYGPSLPRTLFAGVKFTM
ncbi:MAG: TonB-dependent receptor [Petrimonas mucosa]|jgi:outer membrane receptor for ferrienterochelin and colicins|uniref:TonB-dependent receptor n=1 Tax=Petrimonas TaxID=307628 RepID=UPI0008EDCE36|nr:MULTISPECIES: TonB-dependent receptor [Petrimonas]MDD3561358.1 TonB-dependent receptor [Petrimonas mucosa]SFU28302.1 outer membrane receptor for ferrienterochelin and colicins [Porphyromonadaceae bacterium KHP3R9]HHT30264.1 TonB-dependent receptor [Petrimonas mucosa]